MRRLDLLTGGFLLSIVLLVGCAQEPRKPTGYAKALAEVANPQSDQGASDFALAAHGGRFQAPGIQTYIDRIGKKLIPIADLEASDIDITLLNSGEINARVHQDGEILISRGILGLADTEDEVAAVLAHELAHLAAGHQGEGNHEVVSARRALETDIPHWLVKMAFGAEVYEQSKDGTLSASKARRFSHEQEYEADQLAASYLAQAGYDPEAVADILRKFYAFHRAMAYGEDFETISNDWLDTHPTTTERIDRLASHVESLPASADEDGRDHHLAVTDGLLWGNDPKLGSQKGTVYSHPGMGVRFDIPSGFTSSGTREAYVGHDGYTRFLNIEQSDEDLDADIEAFDTMRNARVERFQDRPFPITSIRFPFRTFDVDVFVMLAQVEIRPETFIRFEVMQFADITETRIQQYHDLVKSLRPLSAKESVVRDSFEITTVQVDVGQRFDSWAAALGIEGKLKDVVAILNGVDQNSALASGQRMRVIARRSPMTKS